MADQLSLERNKTVVLIMDYQNRQVGQFPETFQKELLARANAVLARARREGVPVIYIEAVRGERTPEREIHAAVAPRPGELVLTKTRAGPFSTTNLEKELKSKAIDTLALMGISSSGCVLSTVRWAFDTDYKLIVLSDCCVDPDEEVQRVLMQKIFPRQATVVTAAEFLLALGRR
ncbi:MAG: cysteine hydrolase [Chloroflexi bacterium]|nr:cysteine hydrolase [Chloroflexota bacterium]